MEEKIRSACLELMARAPACYLATVDEQGYPDIRAVFNLRNREQFPEFAELFVGHDDDFLLYIGTNTSSRKVAQLRSNPLVSIYFCQPAQFQGLMLSGTIEFQKEAEIKNRLWQEGWERYYPQGSQDPDYTVVSLLPAAARGWYQGRSFEFAIRSSPEQ